MRIFSMNILYYLDDMPTFFIMAGIRLLIIFTIMPIHEFAHAYAAKKMGDNTPLIAGRLTVNPIAHIHPIGAILLFVCGFGWAKPVPINPRNFKNYKKGIAITAFAGPLSNLICAAIGLCAFDFLGYLPMQSNLLPFFILLAVNQFVTINIALAVFNLLPIAPLDGSKILSCFLPYKANAFMSRNQTYITYGFLLLMMLGVLDRPISFLCGLVMQGLNLLFFWIDPLMQLLIG